jgi:hypothetical protein
VLNCYQLQESEFGLAGTGEEAHANRAAGPGKVSLADLMAPLKDSTPEFKTLQKKVTALKKDKATRYRCLTRLSHCITGC